MGKPKVITNDILINLLNEQDINQTMKNINHIINYSIDDPYILSMTLSSIPYVILLSLILKKFLSNTVILKFLSFNNLFKCSRSTT